MPAMAYFQMNFHHTCRSVYSKIIKGDFMKIFTGEYYVYMHMIPNENFCMPDQCK